MAIKRSAYSGLLLRKLSQVTTMRKPNCYFLITHIMVAEFKFPEQQLSIFVRERIRNQKATDL